MSRGTTHLRSLTSLRFFAAAVVVWVHAAIWSTVSGEPRPLVWEAARLGAVGVTFFFMLSGFVLVWSSRQGDTVGGFYRRRFARVWPVHALMWVAALILGQFGLTVIGVQSGLLNLALLQSWSPDSHIGSSFNGVSWSLSDEAFFYAIFPLLYLALRRMRPGVAIAVAVGWLLLLGLVANREEAHWVYWFPPYRVGEFIVGMALALLVQRETTRRISTASAVGVTIVTFVVLTGVDMQTGAVVAREWLMGLGFMPAFAFLIVAYAQRDLDDREGWLTHPWLVRLGQWSFALYMVHELLFRVARPLMLDHAWTVPLAIIAAVVLAGAVYEWFEKPVERRLRGRSRPAVQLEMADAGVSR